MKKATPEPGIYTGIPFAEYASWQAISNSALSRLRKSPAHLRAYLDGAEEDTVALSFGRAAHMAILEPELFADRYVRGIDGDGRTKAVKEARAKLAADHPGAEVLSPDEFDACISMREAVLASGRASAVIGADGPAELSLVWRDEDTGVLCKSRLDKHALIAGGIVVDLKSTRDASRREFERSTYVYGYHRQGAMYLAGARALGLDAAHFVIIAVEKTTPYGVAAYRLTEGALDAGRAEVRALLQQYASCLERDEWPGYPDEFQDIGLPDWAWRHAAEDAAKEAA